MHRAVFNRVRACVHSRRPREYSGGNNSPITGHPGRRRGHPGTTIGRRDGVGGSGPAGSGRFGRLPSEVGRIGRRAGGGKVALDFARLDYVSSVGLRALMVAAKKSRASGRKIAVAALTPVVREIFEISRFNFIIPVFADLRAALASMSVDAVAVLDAGG